MIKIATKADLQTALTWPADADEFKLWFGDKIAFGSQVDTIWMQIKADERATFAFYDQQQLQGFGQCYQKQPGARHIACLIVNAACRGQGLGRRFVTELMQQALAQDDVDYITLNVYPENIPARRLYSDLGFREVGDTRGMVSMQYDRPG
ncbi:acetyltransferase (GNAT) family protein [Idiomarina aquatica]|uniref:Acetyltransferase (GNAT) family protein n=1 Tax=Idiomarina aquatica TaxID=1327752 RepID=A0A4R6PIG2_9GAMM|nr:N-acetyltransferase [Idiomarina aquatica]TDP37635.1 acetyltransferase (GNAT) family protein [Idiomarina aquatica]